MSGKLLILQEGYEELHNFLLIPDRMEYIQMQEDIDLTFLVPYFSASFLFVSFEMTTLISVRYLINLGVDK